jgi:hypothetical protein
MLYGFEIHRNDKPLEGTSHAVIEIHCMLAHIIERMNNMATQAQLDKFVADVQSLIAAGVAEITAAIAAAQAASPDPAIDAADAAVTTATANLTAAAAALTPPPAAPAV